MPSESVTDAAPGPFVGIQITGPQAMVVIGRTTIAYGFPPWETVVGNHGFPVGAGTGKPLCPRAAGGPRGSSGKVNDSDALVRHRPTKQPQQRPRAAELAGL